MFKILTTSLLLIFLNLTGVAYAETLKFGASTYEGDVKKGKANGFGVITFADGSKYEGKFRKNKIHGKGKYTDSDNNVYEGKFSRGKFKNKIDKKTREIIILSVDTGKSNYFEIKGTGQAMSKWFEAEKTSSGTYELTAKGKRAMEAASNMGGSGANEGGTGGGACGG